MPRIRRLTRPIGALSLGLVALTGITGPEAALARAFKTVQVTGARFVSKQSILSGCDIRPGVDYSTGDLDARAACLRATGVFKSVALRPEGQTLVVAVQEVPMRPGSFSLSLAYNTEDSIVGSVDFQRYNLFPNTFGALHLSLSRDAAELTTALYYSGLANGWGLGLDTRLRHTSYDGQGFDDSRARIDGYVAKEIPGGGRVEFGLGYRADKMTDTSNGASALFAREAGSTNAPYLHLGYSYATPGAEKPLAPGASLRLDTFLWGIGSDHKVAEVRLDARSRLRLGVGTDLLLGFSSGAEKGLDGDTTRATDRFQLGGDSFRGFAPRGIGPRDGGYAVGGNKFFVASLEVQHAIGELWHTPARLGAFVDVGSLWSLDDTTGGIDDGLKLRSSVGLSMTFEVGKVPVSLYVAAPVDKQAGDEVRNFGLTISTRF